VSRSATNDSPGRGSRFGVLLLLVGSLVVALLLAEGAFRVLTGEHVELNGMYAGDEVIGVALTPGFHGAVRTSEFDHAVAINDLGMRDGVVGPKAPGTKRVLVIGDSFVFGVGVELGDSLPKALERHLRQDEPGMQVEVFNAGVPGYSPWQELQTLRKLAPRVAPDVVVQVVFMGDDWYGNARRTPPDEARKDLAEWLRVHSALFRFVDRFVLSRLKGGDHYEPHRLRPAPEFEARVNDVVRLLEETRAAAEAAGAQFVAVLCPRYSQVYDDAWAKASLVYRLTADDYSPLEPNRSFGERLRGEGFAVIDLLGPMREEGHHRLLHFPIDGHWNRDGNDFVAALIATSVRARLDGRGAAAG
jgi:hypothetical protein